MRRWVWLVALVYAACWAVTYGGMLAYEEATMDSASCRHNQGFAAVWSALPTSWVGGAAITGLYAEGFQFTCSVRP